MHIYDFFLLFIGLLLGRLFTLWIYVIPRNESLFMYWRGCLNCRAPFNWFRAIPLLGFILLKGHCPNCRERLSNVSFLIECCTPILFVLGARYPVADFLNGAISIIDMLTEVWLLFSVIILIPLVVINLQHFIIPDEFTISGIIIGIVISFLPGGTTPLNSVLGALVGGTIPFLISILSKGGMGGGDIKFLAAIGAIWGWQISLMTIGMFFLFGIFVGVFALATKRLGSDHRLPTVPIYLPSILLSVFTITLFSNRYPSSHVLAYLNDFSYFLLLNSGLVTADITIVLWGASVLAVMFIPLAKMVYLKFHA